MTRRYRALGSVVKCLRLETGLTQRAFAIQAGIKPSTLSRVEAGINSPAWDTLCAIASRLGISASQLVSTIERERH